MKNRTDYKTDKIKIELEKGQKLVVTHKGSVWSFIIEVDAYDDLNIKKVSNYRTPTHLKPPMPQALDTLDT